MNQYVFIPVVDAQGVPDRTRYFRVKLGGSLHQQLLKSCDNRLPKHIMLRPHVDNQQDLDLTLFRKNLQKMRAIRGYSSSNDLSKKCGFKAVKRVADLETEGRGKPTLEEMAILCKVLNVSVDDILFKEIEITFK